MKKILALILGVTLCLGACAKKLLPDMEIKV